MISTELEPWWGGHGLFWVPTELDWFEQFCSRGWSDWSPPCTHSICWMSARLASLTAMTSFGAAAITMVEKAALLSQVRRRLIVVVDLIHVRYRISPTWRRISKTVTREQPMVRPRMPPTFATNQMRGIFCSRLICVTAGSLMYMLTSARFSLAYWYMTTVRLSLCSLLVNCSLTPDPLTTILASSVPTTTPLAFTVGEGLSAGRDCT